MDILDYESTVRPEWWLKQIGDCDWAGARYLYTLLTENRFHGKRSDQYSNMPAGFLSGFFTSS